VIKRWTRLVHGLRIRQRLQDQYADKPQTEERHWLDTQAHVTEAGTDDDVPQAGGYLTAADDVVQAFHLPKYQHVVAAYSTDSPPFENGRHKNADVTQIAMETTNTFDVSDQADDIDMEEINVPQLQRQAENGVPITMRELADAARQRAINGSVDDEELASSTIHGPTNTVDTMSRVTSANTAASGSQSTPPARMASKLRGSARKRARDESEKPLLHAKRGKEDGASSAPVPTPTRVLRPRASKSAAQIREAKEMEHAYRRAIAD